MARTATKAQLAVLYSYWGSEQAQANDTAIGGTGLNWMVIVTRWVTVGKGKRIAKLSQYLFSAEVTANNCFLYWKARGGLINLALCKVEKEYGYTEDPLGQPWMYM